MTPIYQNDLITLAFDNERFIILDSDNKYIDYLFDINNTTNPLIKAQAYVDKFSKPIAEHNSTVTTNLLKDLLSNIKEIHQLSIEPHAMKTDLQNLYKEFGEEFVNRIGNIAIIIKE